MIDHKSTHLYPVWVRCPIDTRWVKLAVSKTSALAVLKVDNHNHFERLTRIGIRLNLPFCFGIAFYVEYRA